MQQISQSAYLGLEAVAAKVAVGIIAVADTPDFPIVFASRVDLLGYTPQELMDPNFGGLAKLLPESIRADHPKWMSALKNSKDPQVERTMGKSRAINGVSKSGEPVPILINISYQAPRIGEIGIYLAFIQSAHHEALPDSQLNDLKLSLTTVLAHGEKVRKHMVKVIARRVAASGGAIAVITAVLSQIQPVVEPVVKIWQASKSAISLKTDGDAKVASYIVIDDDQRFKNMNAMRILMHRKLPSVRAVSYYRIEESVITVQDELISTFVLKFIIDTESDEKNTYFPGDIALTPAERRAINQGDCVVKQQVGAFYDKNSLTPDGELFDAVFYPTLSVSSTDFGLRQLSVGKNVVGVAVKRDKVAPKPTKLEPYCTEIFKLIVNIENLENPNN